MKYRIMTREKDGWDAGTVNEPNLFDSEAEALEAIEALKQSGEDFARAEYRVVPVRD